MPKSVDRTGETRLMNCGLRAEIVEYRSASDMDIVFETGERVNNRNYSAFKGGHILPKTGPNKHRLGEKRMMSCGLSAEIIRYGGCFDIDVRFENGFVVKNIRYSRFKTGDVGRSIFKTGDVGRSIEGVNDRLGEIRMMYNGLRAKIVKYNTSKNYTIRFEDGIEVVRSDYRNFLIGRCGHPYFSTGNVSRNFYGYKVRRCYVLKDKVYYFCEKGGTRDIMTLQEMVIASGGKLVF